MQRASSARWKTLDRRFLLRLFVWSLCQRALTKPVSYNYRWSRQLRAASIRAASTTTRTITMIAATTTITATTTNKRRGVRPPCDVLLCKFNDVVDVMLVRSHEREAPAASVGGEFVPWYLKVSTGEPPDKPRDIWKCQSDKYGSCVVVMQSAPSLTNPSSFHARVVVLPAAFPWALSLSPSPSPSLSHGESVAAAGDRFAPGMEFLSRLEHYREVGTTSRRIFAKWQLFIARNRDTTIRAWPIRHF